MKGNRVQQYAGAVPGTTTPTLISAIRFPRKSLIDHVVFNYSIFSTSPTTAATIGIETWLIRGTRVGTLTVDSNGYSSDERIAVANIWGTLVGVAYGTLGPMTVVVPVGVIIGAGEVVSWVGVSVAVSNTLGLSLYFQDV